LGTDRQGMTKPTSICEWPARTAEAVCVDDGGRWGQGLVASAVTHQHLENGAVPTRDALCRALQYCGSACILLLCGSQNLHWINYVNSSIKGINPSSSKCKNSYGFKFKEVSHSRQVNLDAFPRQNVLRAMDTGSTVMAMPPVCVHLAP